MGFSYMPLDVGDFFLIFSFNGKKFEKSQHFQVKISGRSALFSGRSVVIPGRSEGI